MHSNIVWVFFLKLLSTKDFFLSFCIKSKLTELGQCAKSRSCSLVFLPLVHYFTFRTCFSFMLSSPVAKPALFSLSSLVWVHLDTFSGQSFRPCDLYLYIYNCRKCLLFCWFASEHFSNLSWSFKVLGLQTFHN